MNILCIFSVAIVNGLKKHKTLKEGFIMSIDTFITLVAIWILIVGSGVALICVLKKTFTKNCSSTIPNNNQIGAPTNGQVGYPSGTANGFPINITISNPINVTGSGPINSTNNIPASENNASAGNPPPPNNGGTAGNNPPPPPPNNGGTAGNNPPPPPPNNSGTAGNNPPPPPPNNGGAQQTAAPNSNLPDWVYDPESHPDVIRIREKTRGNCSDEDAVFEKYKTYVFDIFIDNEERKEFKRNLKECAVDFGLPQDMNPSAKLRLSKAVKY
ncbi:MAG: hypothetical protein LBU68_02560, partial [Rickettsiales bacterium]|nr:hypothetical protein [Rickettsiales bacterium]